MFLETLEICMYCVRALTVNAVGEWGGGGLVLDHQCLVWISLLRCCAIVFVGKFRPEECMAAHFVKFYSTWVFYCLVFPFRSDVYMLWIFTPFWKHQFVVCTWRYVKHGTTCIKLLKRIFIKKSQEYVEPILVGESLIHLVIMTEWLIPIYQVYGQSVDH